MQDIIYYTLLYLKCNAIKEMKKVSIDLPDEIHKELLKVKFEKAMKDEKISIGDIAREAIQDWLVKYKAQK